MKKTIIGGLFFIGGILLMGFTVLGNGDVRVLGCPGIIFTLFGTYILLKEFFVELDKKDNKESQKNNK